MSSTASRLRRVLLLVLAVTLSLLTTVVGVTATAPPASAEPYACSFSEYDADGAHQADLTANGEVWLLTWVDGQLGDWYPTDGTASVWVDAAALAGHGGTQKLDYRVYPPGIDPLQVSYNDEALCEVGYAAPAPITQHVTFGYPDNLRVGGAQPLVATADSGLPVAFESSTPLVCSVDGTTVSALVEGECTVRATQAGGPADGVTFAAATPVDRTFSVWPVPAAQSIDFTQPGDMRVGDAAQKLGLAASSELPVSAESLTPQVCTVESVRLDPSRASRREAAPRGSIVTPVAPGLCTVRATQAGTAELSGVERVFTAATPVERTFAVRPVLEEQTLTFPALSDMRVGDARQFLGAQVSSGLPVTYKTTTPDVCTVVGGVPAPGAQVAVRPHVLPVAPGVCTVVATQAGGEGDEHSYGAATPVERTFTVLGAAVVETAKQAQTITVVKDQGVALSAKVATVRFSSSAGQAVSVVSTTPAVCTWKNGRAQLAKAGTCRLTASAAGANGYLAANDVTASFPVWSAPSLPKKAKAARVLDVLGRGEEALRVSAGPAAVCGVVDGGQVALTAAGTCTVSVTDGDDRVRTAKVQVRELDADAPSAADMSLAGSVRFAFRSAALTPAAKATLRRLAPKLRDAQLVAVYGNTQAFGAGDTPANRRLSARRADAVVAFLRSLGVKSKATKVALASRNPAGKDEAANRRADIYWVK